MAGPIVVIQFPAVVDIGRMDSNVCHSFPREMLGYGQVVAVPITIPSGSGRTEPVAVRTRTRVIRAQHHLWCPWLPPTFFPQSQSYGEMPVLVAEFIGQPQFWYRHFQQSTNIAYFQPRENSQVQVIVPSVVSPFTRRRCNVQVRRSHHHRFIPLHVGCGHVQQSSCSKCKLPVCNICKRDVEKENKNYKVRFHKLYRCVVSKIKVSHYGYIP